MFHQGCPVGALSLSRHTQRHQSLASPQQPAMEHQTDSLSERCEVLDSERGFDTCHPNCRKVPPCRAGSASDTASLADLVIPCSLFCCGASHSRWKAGSQQCSSSLYQNCNPSVAMYLSVIIFQFTTVGSVNGTSCLKDHKCYVLGHKMHCISQVITPGLQEYRSYWNYTLKSHCVYLKAIWGGIN